jgi:hypothetical protein
VPLLAGLPEAASARLAAAARPARYTAARFSSVAATPARTACVGLRALAEEEERKVHWPR